MAKTSTLHIRVEPELKVNVESILENLGLTTAEAINIYLNQIVINEGIPFEIKSKPILKKNSISKRKSLSGYLSKYANPKLREKEKDIWMEVAKE